MVKIDVDTSRLIAALDRIPVAVSTHVIRAAKVTAENVAREARGRVRRRTGKTASGIGIDVARVGEGYVVYAENENRPGLPSWIEFGTKKMPAKPFFFASARLEEGAHDRRMRDAIQDAIDESGLGDG